MIEHILLTVDNNTSAQRVLEHISKLAMTNESKVTVLHTYKPAPSSTFSNYFLGYGRDKASLKAKALLKKYVERLKQMGVRKVDSELENGTLNDVLSRVVKSREPDMIVIGSRGEFYSNQSDMDQAGVVSSRGVTVPVLIV